MSSKSIPTAPRIADAVRTALASGETSTADRLVTELISCVLHADRPLPAHILDAPESTGDERYDTLIKVALTYALTSRGQRPELWMLTAKRLPGEWLWDSDGAESPAFRDLVRRQTPQMFLEKGILLRERDLVAP